MILQHFLLSWCWYPQCAQSLRVVLGVVAILVVVVK